MDALLIRRVIQEKKIFVQPLKNKRLYGKILAGCKRREQTLKRQDFSISPDPTLIGQRNHPC